MCFSFIIFVGFVGILVFGEALVSNKSIVSSLGPFVVFSSAYEYGTITFGPIRLINSRNGIQFETRMM